MRSPLDSARRGQTPFARLAGAAILLVVLALSIFVARALAGSEHHGQVTFNGLPVPGATVTATQGEKKLVAITDQQGMYSFASLDDGAWKFEVEMLGFATQTQDITIAADTPSTVWELKILTLAQIAPGLPPPGAASAQTASAATAASANGSAAAAAAAQAAAKPTKGFQRAAVNSSSSAPAPAADSSQNSSEAAGSVDQRAATGLLVNGSVNNGAASAFSQMAAFGNNRRGPGSLYNGGVLVTFDTSGWDAAAFPLGGVFAPKPSYNDLEIAGAVGGPIGFRHHLIAGSNFFVAYQHVANDDSSVLPGSVPTVLERGGNFSQTLNSAGAPVQIYNPSTGMPYAGGMIPVSAQAQALLSEYPLPNLTGAGAYNYQAPVLAASQQDSVQARASKNEGANQYFGNLAFQRTAAQTTSLFGFKDLSGTDGLDTAVNWTHRFGRGFSFLGSQFFSIHLKYEFSRLTTDETPYFANRTNVSGEAGILGNDQTPVNWGPPNLIFSSGIAGLAEPAYARNVNQTQAFSYDSLWNRGRHSISFGATITRQQFNVVSQQDARGALAFTGAATEEYSGGSPVAGTGSDLADFELGIPDTVSISFGNADKYLRGWIYDAFIEDDWRVKSGFTVNAGLRWEFAAPLTETQNRLANLDIAPDFAAAAPVVASDPMGNVSGETYPNSLLRPDYRGVEPRLGIAWRPRPASPMVVRAGYGIYDNTSVYQVIATQLAQQPPFTKTLSLQNSVADPLTLAMAFDATPTGTVNTFAVDPNFRVGYAQNWNASVQEDLPGSLIMTVTYLGTKGTRLMQEDLPNTYPLGATNPCPACPAGFVYLGSNGNSTREAGQIQLRRRLSNGLTATVQYTYAKAIDDASAFSGAGLASGTSASTSSVAQFSTVASSAPSIAQNWLNLDAERGLSTFDQRNLLNFTVQYTSGEGIRGGALLSGWRGKVLKEWTVTAQLTAGSGLPETPVYLTNVQGTGVTGTIRPNLTGASVDNAPAGFFLNAAAYSAPAAGEWGDAGRDSISGPAQFSLNASLGRTFRLNSRLNGDWRMDATNVLNNVTFTSWNTTVTSPLFGLANGANTMRKLQMSFRVRF
jgi:cell division septation protein DedD